MDVAELLADAFERVREVVHHSVAGLDRDALTLRPYDSGNTIAWLVWHLTRVQDDHVAEVAGLEQVWTAHGWAGRFELPFRPSATGYGHRPDQVVAVQADEELLLGYFDAVHAQTLSYVSSLKPADLERVVDESWTPAVTLGVRLISVISDDLQHAGQAAYLRGLVEAA